MTLVGWLQIALPLALVVVCAVPLSRIIAVAYAGEEHRHRRQNGPSLTQVAHAAAKGLVTLFFVRDLIAQDGVGHVRAAQDSHGARFRQFAGLFSTENASGNGTRMLIECLKDVEFSRA